MVSDFNHCLPSKLTAVSCMDNICAALNRISHFDIALALCAQMDSFMYLRQQVNIFICIHVQLPLNDKPEQAAH